MPLLIVSTLVIGIVAIPDAEQTMVELWGARQRHTGEIVHHDFNETNIDEVHGQLIAGWPVFMISLDPWITTGILVISFVLFRYFDAKKIGLVYAIESWGMRNETHWFKGPAGIMLDDTVAGIMAAAIIMVGLRLGMLFI